LDGFAPSKNPEMWSPALFQQIQRLSHSKTTFATFTAARVVKDLLTNHGFEFKKAKGFGRKRDMIHGWSKADDDFSRLSAVECANTQVWFQTPPLAINRPVYDLDSTEDLTPTHSKPKTATIIGAGLAGAHTARLLAERDWQVTVLEQGETVAFGASGNYQGVLYTKPSVQESKEDRFYLAAFQYAVQHYQWRFSGTDLWKQVGLVQIAQNEKDATKLARVNEKYQDTQFNTRISPEEANTLTGLTLNTEFDALHYPDSGWVNPAQACHNLLNHPNITVRCQSRCSELTERPEGWTVTVQHSDTGILSDLETDIVILCSAWESDRFTQTQHLPLTPIRGQVSQLNLNDTSIIAGAQTSIPTPKTVVCSDAYVTPTDQGKLNFGATFDLKDNGMDYRMEDVRKNRTKLASISEDFKALEKIEDDQFSGRASVRCITNDRLPILGMVNNHPAMLEQYQQLRKDRKWPYQTPGHYHKGLFANLGHGSKGLTTIPLCSAVLCAMIENDPLPLGQDLLDSLNPARFTISGLIKGKL
jgi:tRNA 5-methylaminomethyl-2-thiouridine biosynthesis bifunctional protein